MTAEAEYDRPCSLSYNLPEQGISLEDLGEKIIIKAPDRHKENQTRADKYLGITLPTLIYRMEKFGLI